MGEEAGHTPRLVIAELELENFKSYGGVKRIGPFHHRFSAVVGPNGSGKSNVLDALLFAFGKRASKIRLNKVSELIHSSDQFPNLEFARVTVFFQEIVDDDSPQGFSNVDDSSFSISRFAYRNNTSKYFIGDRSSSFTEVTKLLMEKHVDLTNNRFLILQGEVEQISMMKPKAINQHETGLLEYLEDIIGTSKYVEQIHKAHELKEEMEEKKQQKLNLVRASDRERQALAEAKDEAILYRSKLLEKSKFNTVQVQLKLRQLQSNASSGLEKKQKLELEIQTVESSVSSSTQILKETESLYERKKHESQELLQEVEKAKNAFDGFEREYIQKKEEKTHLSSKKTKLLARIQKDSKELEKLSAEIEISKKEIPRLKSDLERLQVKKIELSDQLEKLCQKLEAKTGHLKLELEQKQKELAPFRRNVNSAVQKLEIAKSKKKMSLFN
jgi:structural maintenance of chromosome 4